MSLVARHLESTGVPTVVIGSARDIVETVGVARYLHVDYPLGNPAGKPDDPADQRAILAQALALAERAWTPRTTVVSDRVWNPDDHGWKERFMAVTDENRAVLAAAGEARRAEQAARRERRRPS